ncbi:MAG: hypothetical protein KHZ15_06690 [Coprobacillus cateniformis]|nr:hypothetical protein [Coprobacillus cateniformis]
MVDDEAKIFEDVHVLNNNDNLKTFNILTSFLMYDSCKDVVEQSKNKQKQIKVFEKMKTKDVEIYNKNILCI